MNRKLQIALTSLLLPFALAISSCDDDDPLSPEDVAGEYVASSAEAGTRFEIIAEGETLDILELGGTLEIELRANGITAGRLFVPGLDEGGGDVDQNLAGEWSLRGNTVTFDINVDTFLNDIEFTVRGNRLEADDTIANGTRFVLVLVK